MREIAVGDAETRLGALIDEIERTGDDIVITRQGRPAARLTPTGAGGRTDVQRRASRARLLRRLQDIRTLHPEASDPIAWETVKGWMYDDEDGGLTGR